MSLDTFNLTGVNLKIIITVIFNLLAICHFKYNNNTSFKIIRENIYKLLSFDENNKSLIPNNIILIIYLIYSLLIIINNDYIEILTWNNMYFIYVIYIIYIFLIFYKFIVFNISLDKYQSLYQLYYNTRFIVFFILTGLLIWVIRDMIFNPNDNSKLIDYFNINFKDSKSNKKKNYNLLNYLLLLVIIFYIILCSMYLYIKLTQKY
jgi:hypothetical protein